VTAETPAAGRCARCGTVLSRYNPEPVCASCHHADEVIPATGEWLCRPAGAPADDTSASLMIMYPIRTCGEVVVVEPGGYPERMSHVPFGEGMVPLDRCSGRHHTSPPAAPLPGTCHNPGR
jgi:hypothetical protein